MEPKQNTQAHCSKGLWEIEFSGFLLSIFSSCLENNNNNNKKTNSLFCSVNIIWHNRANPVNHFNLN